MTALLILAAVTLLAFVIRDRELRRNQEIAETRARAAHEQAATQRYDALLHKVREYLSKPRPGGRESALDDLAEAARLSTSARNVVELRTILAGCVAGVDLRRHSTWPMPVDTQVDHLVFSPDGRRLALAQLRGTFLRQVRLVDLADGRHRDLIYPGPWRLDARDTGGGNLAFGPDGRWLALGSRQGDIHLWDTSARAPKSIDLRGAHHDLVDGLAFLPDGTALISGSRDRTLRRWDVASGWKPAGTAPLRHGISDLAVSPDGASLACSSGDGLFVLDAVRSLRLAGTRFLGRPGVPGPDPRGWLQPRRPLPGLAGRFAPRRARRAVAGGAEEPSRPDLEDAAHGSEVNVPPGQSGWVAAAFPPRAPDTVKLWELATGRLLTVSRAASDNREIVMAAWSPPGQGVAVTDGPQAVLYGLDGLKELTIVAPARPRHTGHRLRPRRPGPGLRDGSASRRATCIAAS